jgi:hypothetical protein
MGGAIESEGSGSAEVAHEKRTKTPTTLVTVIQQLN